ncbi:hypothetical protein MPDQ_007423 [Monascus purpureus]|uniref:Acid phosphatase pho5 n=1 Tax=Monascus purpureus TaxID=5098 RepID=A0A507QVF0_MONPU|nr:hypothetical protein MPDQ_007423 [Monascus purpureus]
MTTLVPREPYSQEELERLYPKGLQLQLVQVFLRHGERTPVSSRFQNAFPRLPGWSKWQPAGRISGHGTTFNGEGGWKPLAREMSRWSHWVQEGIWRVSGKLAQQYLMKIKDLLWTNWLESHHGELTDRGRETTFALGQRLRHLYVDQLGFMPKVKSDTDDIYLRTTAVPRALESLQQVFWGMYPADSRTVNLPPPVIVGRSVSDETLFPNEGSCPRFRQLARLFAQRAADRWNETEEMEYLNSIWSKWMPAYSPRIAVDSKPRLSGIMDTVNATDAHGPGTKLPVEFYDKKGRAIMDKIAVDEWFAGYQETNEYRRLGIGALLGDVVDNMVSAATTGGWFSETIAPGSLKNGKAIRFALSGCHDTTLAAILNSVGGFKGEKWPPFTSSIAIELFSKAGEGARAVDETPKKTGFLSFLGGSSPSSTRQNPSDVARIPLDSLPESARKGLKNHYVRVRYNDKPVRIPGCAAKPENHLPGDETFCTLEAFKGIVDKFTPKNWKEECVQNLGDGLFGKDNRFKEEAGYY